jgi:hypothetical protein
MLVGEEEKWLSLYTPDNFGLYIRSPKAVLSIWLGRHSALWIGRLLGMEHPVAEQREWRRPVHIRYELFI